MLGQRRVLIRAGNNLPVAQPGIAPEAVVTMGFLAWYLVWAFRNACTSLMSMTFTNDMFDPSHLEYMCVPGEQMECASIICGGQNGVCMWPGSLYYKCACQNDPCPDFEGDSSVCDIDCGGQDANGKCKGVEVSRSSNLFFVIFT